MTGLSGNHLHDKLNYLGVLHLFLEVVQRIVVALLVLLESHQVKERLLHKHLGYHAPCTENIHGFLQVFVVLLGFILQFLLESFWGKVTPFVVVELAEVFIVSLMVILLQKRWLVAADVGDEDLVAGGHKDVFGLDIAVDYVLRVQLMDSAQDLPR